MFPSVQDPPLDRTLDELESLMARAGGPKPDIRVTHAFTPGLYIRTCFIPAGTLCTSMKHLTRHPFVILTGRVRVMSENEGAVTYEAPFQGITEPGTRRMLHAETDTTWITFHATPETDVEKIGEAILEPNLNPLLEGTGVNPEGWRDSLTHTLPTS